MGPPPSIAPSFSSYDGTESGRNFEAERLQILLHASQEDLRLQTEHFEERERRMREQLAAERAHFAERIQDMERRLGGGAGPSRRG